MLPWVLGHIGYYGTGYYVTLGIISLGFLTLRIITCNRFATVVFFTFCNYCSFLGEGGGLRNIIRFQLPVSEAQVVLVSKKPWKNRFRFFGNLDWNSIWRQKSSSNLYGDFRVSPAPLKIFSQNLLTTKRFRLCEIVHLILSDWILDALEIPQK